MMICEFVHLSDGVLSVRVLDRAYFRGDINKTGCMKVSSGREMQQPYTGDWIRLNGMLDSSTFRCKKEKKYNHHSQ